MPCGQCGAENPPGTKFCANCGAPQGHGAVQAGGPAPQPNPSRRRLDDSDTHTWAPAKFGVDRLPPARNR